MTALSPKFCSRCRWRCLQSEEEKQLVQRYVGKIAQGEDQLERLRLEEKKLAEEKDGRQNQLDDRIRKLAMEHRLN